MHKISFNLGDAFWSRLLFFRALLPAPSSVPAPVSAACCLWPLAGLIYFKTSQTLEQHVRSTKFLACLTRLGIVLVALVFVALPQLLLLLAFAVKKPLKYDAYDKLKCAAHIDETECQKCYKHFDDKR